VIRPVPPPPGLLAPYRRSLSLDRARRCIDAPTRPATAGVGTLPPADATARRLLGSDRQWSNQDL